MISSAVEPLF